MPDLRTYKPLDIYKDLPQTNCKDCGSLGCFQFATAVFVQGLDLDLCPHLSDEKRAEMTEKLGRGNAEEPVVDQTLKTMLEKIAPVNLAERAPAVGGRLVNEPEPAIAIRLYDRDYLVTNAGVRAAGEGDPEPNTWVTILLLYHVIYAQESEPAGRWIGYKEMPQTLGKIAGYEKDLQKLADRYAEAPEALKKAAIALGGAEAKSESADITILLRALPRVEIQLLYWGEEDDFPARISVLYDAKILNLLDQEMIIFMIEELERRLSE